MTQKIAVITDTDSSLPPYLASQWKIVQIPITIHFENESFTTGLDIDDRLLFEKVDRENKLPTTAAPCPEDFVSAFRTAFDGGAEAIICICVSSQVRSTYSAAVMAMQSFPNKIIYVIDSLNMSMAQGFMALTAAEAAQKGLSPQAINDLVTETGKRMHTYALLSTLKYLALSGRVGKFMAGMADTFNIKPILTVKDGKLILLEKIRTKKKATDRMFNLTTAVLNGKRIVKMAIIHVNDPEGAEDLERNIRMNYDCPEEIMIAEITPGLSVHTGSGVVGIVFQSE